MKVLTKDAAEFGRLLEALVNELVDAQCHFRLHQKVVESFSSGDYGRVYSQSSAFWGLTLNAHLDAVLLRLCKAYDQYEGSKPTLTLKNLLETISANLQLFDEPNFRERLRNNPFVDVLAEESTRPDPILLRADLESVSTGNHRVKKLNDWRDKVYSHMSIDPVLNRQEFNEANRLSWEDIETLLKNGSTIVNRYLGLFKASHYATGMIGQDDYLWLLKTAHEAMEAQRGRVEAEFRELGVEWGKEAS